MSTPIAIVCGGAGTGKDTVASFICKYVDCVTVAQADPLKRFGKIVFGFSDDQLWGPSGSRNAEDRRFDDPGEWLRAKRELAYVPVQKWRDSIGIRDNAEAHEALYQWFDEVAASHGLTWDSWHDKFVAAPSCRRPLTARYVLQTLGTEWGRRLDPAIWNRVAVDTAFKLLGGGHTYDRATGLVPACRAEDVPGPSLVVITDGRFRNEVLGVLRVGGSPIEVASPTAAPDADVERAGVAGHRSETELRGVPRHWYRYRIVNDKSQGLGALENKVVRLAKHLTSGTGTVCADFGQAQ